MAALVSRSFLCVSTPLSSLPVLTRARFLFLQEYVRPWCACLVNSLVLGEFI